MAVGAGQTPLLERDAELEVLHAVLAGAATGTGAAVIVEAAAGLGKTRLLAEGAAHAATSGLTILRGRGSELEREFPFGLVRQMLDPVLLAAAPATRARLLSGPAASVEELLLGRTDPTPGAGASLGALLHGLYWVAANLAAEAPLVLLADDLHWSDDASLRFLAFLASRLESLPVAILGARRPAGAEPTSADVLLDEIARVERVGTIALTGLSAEATAALVEQRTGVPDAPFVQACHEVTAGNPFLLAELLDDLERQGVSPRAASAERVRRLVPETITRAVVVRLLGLDPSARRLAQAAAVLGDGSELRHARAVAGLDPADAERAADELSDANVLHADVPLRFVHPLVRQVVYADVARAERVDMHRCAARLLIEDAAPAERAAAHLLQAPGDGDPASLAVLRDAASDATRRGAPEVAIRLLRRALEEPPPAPLRPGILGELAAAERRAGAVREAAEHARAALAYAGSPVERLSAARELGLALAGSQEVDEALELLEGVVRRAASEAPEAALEVEAELVAALSIGFFGRDVVAEALAGRRVTGRTSGERLLLVIDGYRRIMRGDPVDRPAAMIERGLAGDALLRERGPESPPYYQAALGLIVADRFTRAAEVLEAAIEASRKQGSAWGFALASCYRAVLAYRAGTLPDAEAEARSAIEAFAGFGGTMVPANCYLVEVLLEQGRFEEAEAELDKLGSSEEVPVAYGHLQLLLARAKTRLATGRPRAALDDLEELRRRTVPRVANPASQPVLSTAALAHLALAQSEEAGRCAAQELVEAERFGTARSTGIALRVAGLASGGTEGLALLQDAADRLDGSGALLEQARALVGLGSALRRANRRTDARGPLREGLELAERCGATLLRDTALTELRATGARPRRAMLTGVDALTASERRVADLAASGLSNLEIAQALFVSRKTVEKHLGNVYMKLDIASRNALQNRLGGR